MRNTICLLTAVPYERIVILDMRRDESALDHLQHVVLTGKGSIRRCPRPIDPYVERTSLGRTGVRTDGFERPPVSIANAVIVDHAVLVGVASGDELADFGVVLAESGEAEENISGMEEVRSCYGYDTGGDIDLRANHLSILSAT